MNKKILQLALPSIISNITVPLLGLIDVAIVGHLGATAYIGAVAVGGMLFNILYWSFGFFLGPGVERFAPIRRRPDSLFSGLS
jgi:MATE family multidrug resistance protein